MNIFSLLKYIPLFLGASCLTIAQAYRIEKVGLYWLIGGAVFIIIGIFVLLLTKRNFSSEIAFLDGVIKLFILPVKLVLFVIKLLN